MSLVGNALSGIAFMIGAVVSVDSDFSDVVDEGVSKGFPPSAGSGVRGFSLSLGPSGAGVSSRPFLGSLFPVLNFGRPFVTWLSRSLSSSS